MDSRRDPASTQIQGSTSISPEMSVTRAFIGNYFMNINYLFPNAAAYVLSLARNPRTDPSPIQSIIYRE